MNANGFRQFPKGDALFLRHIGDRAALVAALELGKGAILPAGAGPKHEVAIQVWPLSISRQGVSGLTTCCWHKYDAIDCNNQARWHVEQNLFTFTVLGFEGAFNLPVWVAQKRKYFEKHGLDVGLEYVKGSVDMINRMTAGSAHVALTSVDNVLAYRGGQGETADGSALDLVAFMGGDHGFLSLMARPEITSVPQLRGKTLSVDALTTGFAFVLREILVANHIAVTDVTFEAAGGTGNRYRALIAGKHDGTLVRTPFERLAQRQGLNVLARGQSLFSDYLGTVGAVLQSWASQNQDRLVGFILAYREALNWIFDPANHDTLIGILRAEFVELTDDDARDVLEDLLDPTGGLIGDMSISDAGLAQVSRIRDAHAPVPTHRSLHDCVDRQYLRMAQNSTDWAR